MDAHFKIIFLWPCEVRAMFLLLVLYTDMEQNAHQGPAAEGLPSQGEFPVPRPTVQGMPGGHSIPHCTILSQSCK